MADVSIYIPTYNAEAYLARAIESVLGQTVAPREVIVVDDGSSDRSMAIASRYPVRIVRHEQNRGLGAARNTGVRSAHTELVATIESDCQADASWLEQLLSTLGDDAKVAGGGGMLAERDTRQAADRWRAARMKQHHGAETKFDLRFVHGSNTIFRKSAIEEVGGYDERCWRTYEDFDICAKLRQAGYTTFYEPRAVVDHIRHDTLQSVLRTYWWWTWGFETANRSLRNLAGVFAKQHCSRFVRAARTDMRNRDFQLLGIDLCMLAYMPYRDLLFYLSTRLAAPA